MKSFRRKTTSYNINLGLSDEDIAEGDLIVDAILQGLLDRKASLDGQLHPNQLHLAHLTRAMPSSEKVKRFVENTLFHEQGWSVNEISYNGNPEGTWCVYLRAANIW